MTAYLWAVLGVLVAYACSEFWAWRGRIALRKATCQSAGHNWALPEKSPFRVQPGWAGQQRTCRRCKKQSHQREDGSWT